MQLSEPAQPQKKPVRPFILHVSGDFPDPIEPHKTKVIGTLLNLTDSQFDHEVVSINRRSPGALNIAKQMLVPGQLQVTTQGFERGTALSYMAPPRGIRHQTKLLQLGDWLIDHIKSLPRRPDLIVGHKLAIEGIAVRRAAQALNIPYALSIQGDSDTKIMSVRRDLNSEFRAVLNGAKLTFPFAPWAWKCVTSQLRQAQCNHIMLPCPTDLDQPVAPVAGGDGLISVFHLQSYKRKNLKGLAAASRIIERDGFVVSLSIIGGGSDAERAECERIVEGLGSVDLAGAMGREELSLRMRRASGFVLPSLRESFGLVFVEALFAGLPIIYPKGTAVDGYFDDSPFALSVDARDPQALASAMRQLMENEAEMKAALAEWQTSSAAQMFRREAIGNQFARGLKMAAGLSE